MSIAQNLNDYDIALISHECTLTGAPVVLLNLAKTLQTLNFKPIIFSISTGPLEDLARNNGVPLLVENKEKIIELLNKSGINKIFVNTVVNFEFLLKLAQEKHIYWWLHETKLCYKDKGLHKLPEYPQDNWTILSGGDFAKKIFEEFRPKYPVQNLYYYVDEVSQNSLRTTLFNKKKLTFLCAGSIEKRKGQDILLAAINKIPFDLLNDAEFWFIGRILDRGIFNELVTFRKKGYPINFIDIVSSDELNTLIFSCDFLVCPSRLDPLPVVVSIGMSLGKKIIISRAVGTSSILENSKDNYIVQGDMKSYVEAIKSILIENNTKKLERGFYSSENKELFRHYFSKTHFLRKVKELLS